jgi:CheY-like chemotaxis protein
MLQRLGCTPHTLKSGEEAIAFLDQMREAAGKDGLKEGEYPELIRGPSAEEESHRRDAMDVSRWIVLMDVIMDGMNGMEATRVIRSRGHRMPILALTANVMQEDKDKAKASGMDGFIEKPLRMQELETAIKTAMEQQQRQPDAEQPE